MAGLSRTEKLQKPERAGKETEKESKARLIVYFSKSKVLFAAPDRTLTLPVRSPSFDSKNNHATAVFVPVADIGNTLILKRENSVFARLFKR